MGAQCQAAQMLLGKPASEFQERRLNLVPPGSETSERSLGTLGDYVWSLAAGDSCFSCGKGVLVGVLGARATLGGAREQSAEGGAGRRLVCEFCGAEVGAFEAA